MFQYDDEYILTEGNLEKLILAQTPMAEILEISGLLKLRCNLLLIIRNRTEAHPPLAPLAKGGWGDGFDRV